MAAILLGDALSLVVSGTSTSVSDFSDFEKIANI